jgi:hypothetical protein
MHAIRVAPASLFPAAVPMAIPVSIIPGTPSSRSPEEKRSSTSAEIQSVVRSPPEARNCDFGSPESDE